MIEQVTRFLFTEKAYRASSSASPAPQITQNIKKKQEVKTPAYKMSVNFNNQRSSSDFNPSVSDLYHFENSTVSSYNHSGNLMTVNEQAASSMDLVA